MKKKTTKRSAVITLLDHVYQHSLASTGHSWDRLNTAMRAALAMSIGVGFKFDVGDFKHIASNYKSGHWLGDDVEWWYSQCVADNNATAIASFEAWKERGPLIADDVSPTKSHYAHVTSTRSTCRLAVGFSFPWMGYTVTVTSFKADGSCTACAYKRDELPPASKEVLAAVKVCEDGGYNTYRHGYSEQKAVKRFTISRDAIIRERADAKRRVAIEEELSGMANYDKARNAEIVALLGVKTRAEVLRLPVAKMEKVLAKCLAKWGDE